MQIKRASTPNSTWNSTAPLLLTCTKCKETLPIASFPVTSCELYADGHFPFCADCVNFFIGKNFDDEWTQVDKLCQLIDIPFLPEEWEKIKKTTRRHPFLKYAEMLKNSDYESLEWDVWFHKFSVLQSEGHLEDELPLLGEEKRNNLRRKWGGNYDDEALNYLESLYSGLLQTQNVNGTLQADQAIKLCKISYEIDCRIREGSDFDKLLSSYEKLVKAAEFTPRNVKNINDFDTLGELIRWCEKRGWKNPYFDDVSRDIVDETIKNIQSFNQHLYINESGIGDEITRRIEALNSTEQVNDDYYGLDKDHDLEAYELEGYEKLVMSEEEEEFDPEES